ncbi:MAG TPA: methionyl-tRNA formyltransferase [Pseudolysinimonas sp.]|nr:methionyl-tRNA formyltransferase [Pseudolysinimonas sp.]
MRIVFAGSPAAAVPSLQALIDGPHEVVGVITREPAPQGRKRTLTPTPVAELAGRAGLPLIETNRLGPVTDELIALDADLGVIVAYGGLVREPLLSAPRLGWINLHFSLLPRWRGAAPVQRAVMAGDQESGVSVFRLVPELDAGDLLATEPTMIGRNETAGHLLEVLAVRGAQVLASVVDRLDAGTVSAVPQTGEPSYAPKLALEDGRIDWADPAERVDAIIRGVTPEPGAFTEIAGERLKIHEAAIAHGVARLTPGGIELRAGKVLVGTSSEPLELLRVQPAGKTAMDAAAWWRGRPPGATVVAG